MNCECGKFIHPVISEEEWQSLNSFREQFQIDAVIINNNCIYCPMFISIDSIHAETLHMSLVNRTWT